MEKDSDIKNRISIRLKNYDYSLANGYFVTLCTYQRQSLFGNIENSQMILNEAGRMVEEEWIKTGHLRSYLDIHPYVVMPNHFHAIVIIHKAIPQKETADTARRVPTVERKFGGLIEDSLSSIMGSFKSAVTKRIHENGKDNKEPVWQSRFYDHVIRNNHEYELISRYIYHNPGLWDHDDNNPDRINVIKGIQGLEKIFKAM